MICVLGVSSISLLNLTYIQINGENFATFKEGLSAACIFVTLACLFIAPIKLVHAAYRIRLEHKLQEQVKPISANPIMLINSTASNLVPITQTENSASTHVPIEQVHITPRFPVPVVQEENKQSTPVLIEQEVNTANSH